MDGARAQFLEGVVELHEAWELACELGGNSDELTARRDELAEKVGEMTRGEELLREKISEKQDERTQIEEDIEKFNEIKGVLEETCERLGLENEELLAIKAKIDEEYVFSWLVSYRGHNTFLWTLKRFMDHYSNLLHHISGNLCPDNPMPSSGIWWCNILF